MQTPVLSIRLFGALDLRYGDRLLSPLASARAETLLAYLVLHRDTPQSRQHLAFVLWPDSSEAQARTNLRHVLHDLRRGASRRRSLPRCLAAHAAMANGCSYWLDVAAFEDALARARGNDADGGIAALQEAITTYAGDLLDGCYDDWLQAPREHLRMRYLEALERLTTLLSEHGDYAQATGYAERLIHNDPLNEEAYRLLMRLHEARGQLARALQTYHLCSATLERELGVEPSPATREAYEALLPAERDRGSSGETVQTLSSGDSSLVGRASEWTRLTTLWRETRRRPGPGRAPQRRARRREDAARRGAAIVVCPDRSRDRGSSLLRERRRNGLRAVGHLAAFPRDHRASRPARSHTSHRIGSVAAGPYPVSLHCHLAGDRVPNSGGACSKPPLTPSMRREDHCCSSPMICNGATRRPFNSSTTSCGSSQAFLSSWRRQRDGRRSIRGTRCTPSSQDCMRWSASRRSKSDGSPGMKRRCSRSSLPTTTSGKRRLSDCSARPRAIHCSWSKRCALDGRRTARTDRSARTCRP